jgi:CheY-like chemotaxis protein
MHGQDGTSILKGKRVLVVEDNAALCFVLEDTLRCAGCEVVGPYSRLHDALAAVPEIQIDVALLDINLRGELVSPLAAVLRTRGVPFVLASAYHPNELPRALQSGVHLRKPFSDVDLLDGLASVMSMSAEPIYHAEN